MPKPPAENYRLVRITEICLALPESLREDTGDHANFSVRGKKFAYYLNNHHRDGIVSVCCKAVPGEGEMLLSDTNRFYKPAYIGPRGWVGFRLDRGEIDWDIVAGLVTDSYRLTAPKRLAASVTKSPI